MAERLIAPVCYTDGRKRSGGSNPPRPARQQFHPDRPSEAGRELGSGFRGGYPLPTDGAGHVPTSFSYQTDTSFSYQIWVRCQRRRPPFLKCRSVVHCPCTAQHGEMAERIKAAVPKTAVHPVHRRFESYSHRQKTNRGYGGIGRRNGLRRRGRKTCRFESCYPHHDMYHWLSWIERRTTNAENGGSNPSWYATRRGYERPGADATYPNHLLGWIRGVPEKRRATCRRTP